MLVHIQDQVPVFFVDRIVGHDGADELANQALRILSLSPARSAELVYLCLAAVVIWRQPRRNIQSAGAPA